MIEGLFPLGMQHYLVGGLLIGAGVALLFGTTGLVGGMSSFFSSTWSWLSRAPGFQKPALVGSRGWRLIYALGVIAGAALFVATGGAATTTGVPWWRLIAGGFLVGFGARLGGGCTSGHGICGLSSLQLPSLLAVLTFLATGMITAQLVAAMGATP